MQSLRHFLFLVPAICLAIGIPDVHAGLININLTKNSVTPTGTGPDGNAILGGGIWNRIDETDTSILNALVDSKGAATPATAIDAAFPSGFLQVDFGNAIQKESWGFPVDLTVSGLIANQVYKVAVYSDRNGSTNPSDTYTVNGTSKVLPNPGEAMIALPGTEGTDYALFLVNASATGTILISAPIIAGIQIEGLLPGELGPQPDLSVSKSATKAGKGIGAVSAAPMKSQTLRQETTKKRARRFYVEAVNAGEEVDVFYLMGWWKKKKSKVKVFDNTTGGNVTAQALLQSYRYQLCRNEKRQFKVVVRSKDKKPRKLKTRIGAAPSTFSTSRWDLVTLLTEVDP